MKLLLKFITDNPTLFAGLISGFIIIVSGLLSFAFFLGDKSGKSEQKNQSNKDDVERIENKIDKLRQNLKSDINEIFQRINSNSQEISKIQGKCKERKTKVKRITNKLNGGIDE